jgi:hypothetical protein
MVSHYYELNLWMSCISVKNSSHRLGFTCSHLAGNREQRCVVSTGHPKRHVTEVYHNKECSQLDVASQTENSRRNRIDSDKKTKNILFSFISYRVGTCRIAE